MRCPRCTLVELSEVAETCELCGYSAASVAVAEVPLPVPSSTASPTELDARRELARDFRIDSLLEGPPGQIVYLAHDAQDRPVRLQVVPRAEVRSEPPPADAATKLDHPHIVPYYGHGVTENFVWYATKHVDGRSLGTILRTAGPIELAVCLRIFEQVWR